MKFYFAPYVPALAQRTAVFLKCAPVLTGPKGSRSAVQIAGSGTRKLPAKISPNRSSMG